MLEVIFPLCAQQVDNMQFINEFTRLLVQIKA